MGGIIVKKILIYQDVAQAKKARKPYKRVSLDKSNIILLILP